MYYLPGQMPWWAWVSPQSSFRHRDAINASIHACYGCSRNTCNDLYDIVTILRRPQLPILRGDRLMLSFCIHHIYMNNRSPAPHTTGGAPNRIARHQHETYNKSLHNTTKAHASSCERRNARPHSRSLPARPQTTTGDCPCHPSRHGTTCPHAAAQTLPEAVAHTCALPAAPQLLHNVG